MAAEGVRLTRGEREALTAWWDSDWPPTGADVLDTLADVVGGIVAGRLAKVEALADDDRQRLVDYDAEVDRWGSGPDGWSGLRSFRAIRLRAALGSDATGATG